MSTLAKREQARQQAIKEEAATIVAEMSLRIYPRLHDMDLPSLAIHNYIYRVRKDIKLATGDRPLSVDRFSDAELNRLQVNYIRHCLTNYDRLLVTIPSRSPRVREEVALLLHHAVLREIATRLPHLETECYQQIEVRQDR